MLTLIEDSHEILI